jgi:hypothetical protein
MNVLTGGRKRRRHRIAAHRLWLVVAGLAVFGTAATLIVRL